MIKIGLIVEYNPLHNGHKYLYDKIKELYPDSLVIAIESAEFSQRGELNVFDKFTRAKQTLSLGVDLVLSNPMYHSMNNASTFAYSNIYYLNKCKVDKIICGSENGSIALLDKMYLIENDNQFENKLKEYLSLGYSYKSSYMKTFEYFNISFKSNDLLAYFYYKAIKEINPNIKLELINRINNNYNDTLINTTSIQSATSLRLNQDNLEMYVPKFVYEDYLNFGFRDINNLLDLIKYSLLLNNHVREKIDSISKKQKTIIKCNSYQELVNIIKTKSLSTSNINRFLISSLFNINSNYEKINSNYIRVLGFNDLGKSLLNDIKKDVIIYTSLKNNINYEFDLEIFVDKILDTIYKSNLLSKEIKGPIIK